MNVQQAIMQRRSTRGFDGKPLSDAEIKTLIDAALQSPSAMNKQPWHFAFVKDAQVLAEFNAAARAHMLKSASAVLRSRFDDPNYELLMGAPLFVVITVAADLESAYAGVDCGIAVENLALSAMGLGLGSVIVGMPSEVFKSEKADELKAKMGIPADHRYVIGILIGHNTVTKEAHPIEDGRVSVV